MSKTLTTNQSVSFKKKLVATAVASAMMGVSGFAFAQEDAMEEVVVTGIKGSLQRSMDIKRESQGVVDAISAEDIGKFPDANLAESLQRITGVSIDRNNGEGSKVTVRGFGPDYNLVTLNGRQMPGASINATSASGSRSFDFSNLASEGISGVEVYKTVRAANPAGGVGATINIKTNRPLDNPGLKLSGGIKGVYDDSASDASLTPEVSGLYSQTFADDKFGVGLSLSVQEREGGSANATIGTGWRYFPGDGGGWGSLNPDGEHVNRPEAEDIYAVPQQLGYTFSEYERTRINSQLVMQFAPTDDVTATLDYTYSRKEESAKFSDVGAWFNFGPVQGVWTDNGTGAIEAPLLYREINQNGADLTFGAGLAASLNENKSIGFNVEWNVNDRLSLGLDVHNSKAESRPDNEFGNSNIITTSAFVRDSSAVILGGEMPILNIGMLDSALVGDTLSTQDLQITGSSFRNSQMVHEIDQIQIKGNFALDDHASIDFGVSRIEQSNDTAFANNQRDTWSGLGSAGDVPQASYGVTDIASYFDNVSGSNHPDLLGQRFIADFNAVVQYAADNFDDGGGYAQCANGSTYYCMSTSPDEIRRVEEDSNSLWVQLNVNSEFGGIPTRISTGLRYEETTTRAYGSSLEDQFTGRVNWIGANEMYLERATGYAVELLEQGKGRYDYLLPSVDVSFDLAEDVVMRTSYGRSLGRPLWNQLSGLAISSLASPTSMFPLDDDGELSAGGSGSRGNIALKPIIADNFDLSLEWYYGEGSYVSVGYYKKDVQDFIGTRSTVEKVLDAPNPSAGDRRDAAVADQDWLQWSTGDLKQWIVNNTPVGGDGVDHSKNPAWVYGIEGQDPDLMFNITSFVNEEDASFDGYEFAVQHTFGESGFGVLANYTISDSNTHFDNMLLEGQFALTGLSDTANLIGFYEKDGVQLRISYNWRDEFLSGTGDGTGPNPTYVEAYDQIDLSASYDITENLTIFLEGLNVTNEYIRTHSRSSTLVNGVYTGGARYNIGARYTF